MLGLVLSFAPKTGKNAFVLVLQHLAAVKPQTGLSLQINGLSYVTRVVLVYYTRFFGIPNCIIHPAQLWQGYLIDHQSCLQCMHGVESKWQEFC
jgi:hypothetical protein